MKLSFKSTFDRNYSKHLQHLKLKGLQPKTIDAYSRAIRRVGEHFSYDINDLSEQQLADYFSALLETHSWSAIKLDLYGLKFFYQHVLHKPWTHVDLIKPPKAQRLPDILTIAEAGQVFATTHKLSYRVFFFTVYSLGLRLGEGINLQIGDIDTGHRRVIVRDAKGNKDRLVPLPEKTLRVLRDFWSVHRNPVWLFPSRAGGLKGGATAQHPLDRGGIQVALGQVVSQCGIKKRSPYTAFATAMPPI